MNRLANVVGCGHVCLDNTYTLRSLAECYEFSNGRHFY